MVTDRHVDKNAAVALQTVTFPLDDIGISEADTLFGAFLPGYAFEIVDVQAIVFDVTAEASVDVKITTTSALSAALDLDALGDGVRGSATLSATLANRRGLSTEEINVHVTTDGSGGVEGGMCMVTFRPRGMKGDADPVLG